jgi:hypothetical protein
MPVTPPAAPAPAVAPQDAPPEPAAGGRVVARVRRGRGRRPALGAGASEPPARRTADEEDDERVHRRALARDRRERQERAARAKFWFWVKLFLLVAGLAGIVVGVQLIVARWNQAQLPPTSPKPKIAPR